MHILAHTCTHIFPLYHSLTLQPMLRAVSISVISVARVMIAAWQGCRRLRLGETMMVSSPLFTHEFVAGRGFSPSINLTPFPSHCFSSICLSSYTLCRQKTRQGGRERAGYQRKPAGRRDRMPVRDYRARWIFF